MSNLVLSLCDRTTIALRPWADAGFECIAVDMQHPAGVNLGDDGITRVGMDVRHYLPPRREYAFAMGFPPCTSLAVSGARWFKGKGLRMLADAIDVFGAVVDRLEWCGCPAFAENPVSVISSHYRKPDFTFHPHEYAGYLSEPWAESYTKTTNLWTFGRFKMPPPNAVPPLLGGLIHRMGPSPDRGDLRSVWPAGFALAVYQANSGRAAEVAA